MAKWVIDEQGIAKARKRLRLKYAPIEIKRHRFTGEDKWMFGQYHPPTALQDIHLIWLNPKMDKDDAALTIWHELAHALQCERDFGGDGVAYMQEVSRAAAPLFTTHWPLSKTDYELWQEMYLDQPYEREAEDLAHWYSRYIPVVTS